MTPAAGGARPLWIAVEGLDGVGKSTLVGGLADALGAEVVRNPPASLAAARVQADAAAPEPRRAWYLEANRVAAQEAQALVRAGSWVVMDRSAASTVAFGAAERGAVAAAADWPDGLPRPDLLVFLDLDEAARRARIGGRPGARTDEEGRLVTDAGFRDRVVAGYRALCAQRVDAAGAAAEVLAQTLALARAVSSGGRG